MPSFTLPMLLSVLLLVVLLLTPYTAALVEQHRHQRLPVSPLTLPVTASLSPSLQEYDIFTEYSFSRPEGTRKFYLYSPSHYTRNSSAGALPLIMFFHGFSDNCEQFITQFSVYAFVAEEFQYHYAIMCGTPNAQGTVGWNAGLCCLGNTTIDDIAYTRYAVNMIKGLVKVDATRVFATGHSNGAFMSEALACNASDVFRAVASNAGGTVLRPGNEGGIAVCDAQYGHNSTSILIIHGTADTSVPIDGNPSSGLPSTKRDFAAWANRTHCVGEPVQTLNRGVATNQVYESCSEGNTQVEFVTIQDGVHMWYVNSDFRSSSYTLAFFDRVTRRLPP